MLFYRQPFFFVLLILLPMCTILRAQDSSSLYLIKKIEIAARFVEVDRMQQIYALTDAHTIRKYSADGEFLKTFNENNLGEVSSLDVTNPFQIMVFYGEYQTVIVLDRSLSEIYRFRLSDMNFVQLEAVALSTDNRLWVYDPNSFKLYKIENSAKITIESPDLTAILDESFFPKSLREAEFQIFANDPEKGLIIFDNFGNFIQKLAIPGIEYFQVSGRHIFWMDNEMNLHRLHLKTYREEITPLKSLGVDSKNLLQFCIMPDRYLLRYPDSLMILGKQ
jgi:hypothetical protein